jgi:hypothetical protein
MRRSTRVVVANPMTIGGLAACAALVAAPADYGMSEAENVPKDEFPLAAAEKQLQGGRERGLDDVVGEAVARPGAVVDQIGAR